MANPRIDDLRKKLDKEPGSRLFAQLAEELRKEGDLAEAIRVSRQGLSHHQNYPSARMTLGRALLDSGDLDAARREFETVLKGAPDNILASRYLAECLEGLGQTAEALARYRQTLALAPGDKQVQARIQALEKGPVAAGATAPRVPPAVPASAPAAAAQAQDTEAPIRLVEVEGPMELTSRFDEAMPLAPAPPGVDALYEVEKTHLEPEVEAAAPTEPAPVPLVPVYEQEFELERPLDARALSTPQPESEAPVILRPEPDDEPILEAEPVEDEPPAPVPIAAASAPAVAAEPEPVLLEPDVMDEEFDVETPAAGGRPRVTFRDIVEESPAAADEGAPAGAAAPPPAAPAPPEPELSSPTLAELYFDQGFFEKAIDVYRRLLQRDPGNDRLRVRLGEIEAIQRGAAGVVAAAAGSREEAIGRAIARLQGLRAALARRS